MVSKQPPVRAVREAHTPEQLVFYIRKNAIPESVHIPTVLAAIWNTAYASGATNLFRKEEGDDLLIEIPLAASISQSDLSTLPVKLLSLIRTEFGLPRQR